MKRKTLLMILLIALVAPWANNLFGQVTVSEGEPWTENFDEFQTTSPNGDQYLYSTANTSNDKKVYRVNVLLPTWDVYPPYTNNPKGKTQVGVYVNYDQAAFSGKVCVQFWNRDNADGTILILPEFSNINDLEFKFKASKANNTLGTLTVGYWKDDQYTALHTVSSSDFHSRGSSGHNATGSYAGPFTFENAPSDSKIALRYYYPDATTSTGGCINLDDFVIRNRNCSAPTDLVNVSVTGTTASFSWTGSGNSQYVCVPQGDTPDWSNAVTTSSTSVTVPGLASGTDYDFYVRRACDVDMFSDDVMLSFTTDAIVVTYDITVTANEPTWGTVTGGGTYNEGATATLTATPASKYFGFVNWTKNGQVVSTNATYTFTVTEDATYVANFEYFCEAITVTESTPWTENFDNFYHSSTTFASEPWTNSSAYYVNERCWDVDGPYSFPALYFDTPVAFSGRGNLQFMNRGDVQILILPEFTNALNTLQFEFKGNYYNYQGVDNQGTLEIGYYDGNGFHAVCTSDKITTPRGSSGQNATGDYMGPFPLTGDIPSGSRMALRYTPIDPTIHTNTGVATGCINLDDFRVSIIPTCIPPTNLAANDITTNSAVLSWTANSEETVWTVYYKKTTDADYTEVAHATNPYTLEGLDSNNQYQYYVVANCSDDDQSTSSALFSFNTEAEAHPTKIVLNPTDSDEMTWEQFVSYVNNNGDTYEGKTVTLMEDISVTTMVGTTSSHFSGTFDGQGHTITIDYTSTDIRCGVFNTADNATFMNLRISGTMSVSHFPSGALVGYVHDGCHFINCVSDVEITATESSVGDKGLGGFLGEADRGSKPKIYFDGCAFTGRFIGDCNGWGGFVGRNRGYVSWSSSNSDIYFTDCVFAPTSIPSSTSGCATFARSDSYSSESNSHIHINNCYYTQALGQVQGKRAYSITSFVTNINPITVELYGEHTYYDVSDIDGYATGIVYNGTIYAGNGDNVALDLEGSPSGAYDVTYGTITGIENPFTLAMEAHDTEVLALTCAPPNSLEVTDIGPYSAVLNWDGNADNYNVRYIAPLFFESFENGLGGWTLSQGDPSSMGWYVDDPSQSASLTAHSGTNVVWSFSDVGFHADDWLVSPLIDLGGTLKYWAMSEYQDAYEVVLFGPTIDTVTLRPLSASTITWTEVGIDLSAYEGQQGHIAFHHDYTDGFFLMIDDIGLYGWCDPIPVEGHSYLLEGLEAEAECDWEVQADCGEEDGQSIWVPGNFSTIISCEAPTGLTVNDITAHSAVVSWDAEEDVTFQYSFPRTYHPNIDPATLTYTDIQGNSKTLINLREDEDYAFFLRKNCHEDGYSEIITILFHTLEACPAPTNLSVTGITRNDATISWEGVEPTFEYVYVETGFAPDWSVANTTSNSSVTLTDLSSATDYTFYVRGACDAADISRIDSISFVTDCDPITILEGTPWEENFDGYGLAHNGGDQYQYSTANGSNKDAYRVTEVLDCWKVDPAYTRNGKTQVCVYTAYAPAAYSGEVSVQFWNRDNADGTVLILPEFSNPLSQLEFKFKGSYYSQSGNLVVGYWNNDQFYPVEEAEVTIDRNGINSHLDEYVGTFTFPSNAEGRIALRHYYPDATTSTGGCINLDDFVVSVKPSYTLRFTTAGNWNEATNWTPNIVPNIFDDAIVEAAAIIPNGIVAEANNITFETGGSITIADGGQLKTNADVTATVKKNILGYGINYVETDNGYYLMALPTTVPISAADAGLLTNESEYDLYSWDRTATDEEWHNNHDGIDLQNGMGYLYANRNDMEMSFTATLRNSGESVIVTPPFDEVEHGGWSLFGNPFPCEAYITTDAEGMTFYRLIGNELVPITGAIAPMEGFFVKATAAGQTFTISREAPEGR